MEVPSHPELEKLDEEGNFRNEEEQNKDLVELSKRDLDPFAEEKPPFEQD